MTQEGYSRVTGVSFKIRITRQEWLALYYISSARHFFRSDSEGRMPLTDFAMSCCTCDSLGGLTSEYWSGSCLFNLWNQTRSQYDWGGMALGYGVWGQCFARDVSVLSSWKPKLSEQNLGSQNGRVTDLQNMLALWGLNGFSCRSLEASCCCFSQE